MAGYVQSISNIGGALTFAQTFASPVAAHNLLVADVLWNPTGGAGTCSLSDTVNGAWTPIGSRFAGTGTNAGLFCQQFYLPNTAAGTPTVTATVSATSNSGVILAITEVSGMSTTAPLDGANFSYTNVAGNNPSTASITPSLAGCYIHANCNPDTGATAVGAPFTQRETFGGAGTLMGDDLQVVAAPISASFTATATDNVMAIVSFVPPSLAASPAPLILAPAFRPGPGPAFFPTLTLGDQTVSTGAAFSAVGVTATMALTAPTGGVAVTLPGATSALVLSALVGSVNTSSNVSIPGVTATVVLAANPGSVSTTLPGSAAAVVLTPNPGIVSVTLPGTTSSLVLAARTGGVSVSLPGTTGAVVLTALVGSVNTSSNITIPGAATGVVFSALVGSVNTTANVSISGVTATLVLAAQPGAVAVALPGVKASLVLAAPVGSVTTGAPPVIIPGVTATQVFTANPGVIAVTLPGVRAALVLIALAGAIGGGTGTLTASDSLAATLAARDAGTTTIAASEGRTGGPT